MENSGKIASAQAEPMFRVTAAVLFSLFAAFGPLLVLQTDNGPPFVACVIHALLIAWSVNTALIARHPTLQYPGCWKRGISPTETRNPSTNAPVRSKS